MLQDPLNDAMATIRNAEAAGKAECFIRPASKLIGHVLKVMEEHQYIRSFELVEDGRGNLYRVGLVGSINNCGVIKPDSPFGGRILRSSRPATCPRRISAS